MPVSPHFKGGRDLTGTPLAQQNLGCRERFLSRRCLPVQLCHRGHLAEAAELRRGLHAQAIHEHPSTPKQSIGGPSDRSVNGIDNLVVPREC